MNKFFLILNFYLIKSFLKRLIYVASSASVLIFIISIYDVMNKIKGIEKISTTQVIVMGGLQVPPFLADISVFIILVSAIITLFSLSSKSEITIMRSMGLSIWQILSPIIITNFIIGLLFIFLFLPITIEANKKYTQIERKLIKKEQQDGLAPSSGIWLRQKNTKNNLEEIKIRANKIYKNNLKLETVTVWFFDQDNRFYKRLDAKEMYLSGNHWFLKSIILNDDENINKEVSVMEIGTNLDSEFVIQKIVNNFEDVKLFSIFSLPRLINNLESAGFSSRKFKVYFHSLLNYPILFMCMGIIGAYFAINSIRSRNHSIYIVFGIIFGLFIYVGLNIVNAFGASGMIPLFMSTWLITLLFLATSILLIFKKESL